MENADRYSMVMARFDNLHEYLKACSRLRLHFFVQNSPQHSDACEIYIFLDRAGMMNYLSKQIWADD